MLVARPLQAPFGDHAPCPQCQHRVRSRTDRPPARPLVQQISTLHTRTNGRGHFYKSNFDCPDDHTALVGIDEGPPRRERSVVIAEADGDGLGKRAQNEITASISSANSEAPTSQRSRDGRFVLPQRGEPPRARGGLCLGLCVGVGCACGVMRIRASGLMGRTGTGVRQRSRHRPPCVRCRG